MGLIVDARGCGGGQPSDDHVAVFGCFFENVVSVSAPGSDLHPLLACIIDGGLHESLSYVLASQAFIHLGVVNDHQIRSVPGKGQLGDPFAVPFDKKCAAAPMFVSVDLHIYAYYIKRKVVKQTSDMVCLVN